MAKKLTGIGKSIRRGVPIDLVDRHMNGKKGKKRTKWAGHRSDSRSNLHGFLDIFRTAVAKTLCENDQFCCKKMIERSDIDRVVL